MGQFLIVQASEHGATEAIFRNGLRAFERIAGLQPSGCLFSPRLAMASFPQLLGAGAGLTVEPESGRRVCQAGLCFYRGRAGTAALEELALDLENGVSTLDDLEGIFALASARPGSGELTVITDRLGSLHVYLAPLGPACLITTSALVAAAVCGAGWDRLPRRCRWEGSCCHFPMRSSASQARLPGCDPGSPPSRQSARPSKTAAARRRSSAGRTGTATRWPAPLA